MWVVSISGRSSFMGKQCGIWENKKSEQVYGKCLWKEKGLNRWPPTSEGWRALWYVSPKLESFSGYRPKKLSHTYFCSKIVMLVSHYKQSLFKQRPGRILKFSTTYQSGDQIFHGRKTQHGFLSTQRLQTISCFILCPSQPVTSRCWLCALS